LARVKIKKKKLVKTRKQPAQSQQNGIGKTKGVRGVANAKTAELDLGQITIKGSPTTKTFPTSSFVCLQRPTKSNPCHEL